MVSNFMVLGIASEWSRRKGFDTLVKAIKELPSNYTLVAVGLDSDVEMLLPDGSISVRRTENQKELAEIYASADVYVNLTREDNFPTVNIEALACGTPVITTNCGGSGEIIDEKSGILVSENDIRGIRDAIINVCEQGSINPLECRKRAEEKYDKGIMCKKYMSLYGNRGE